MDTVTPPSRISGPSLPFVETELVFALVAPVGANLGAFVDILVRKLGRYRYNAEQIHVSGLIKHFKPPDLDVSGSDAFQRIRRAMHQGSCLRLRSGKGEFLALAAMGAIQERRDKNQPLARTAHVIRSLKHPDEVRALRRVYGPGFFLIGVGVPAAARREYLENDMRCTPEEASDLLQRDEHEENPEYVDAQGANFGQRMRDTFHLADVFLKHGDEKGVERFLDVVFGCPFITPSRDEHAMFLAYAASLRSSDLSRQVGAVITARSGDVIGTGANDVPKAGGGLYGPDDTHDQRDFRVGWDSNERQRNAIVDDVLERLRPDQADTAAWLEDGRRKLRGSPLMDITEYGRAVHAEMEAILSCARTGASLKGATLYCTTFPCHNCAKHIVDVGIKRVVYVEPYPKSQARALFSDSIALESLSGSQEKVTFEAFVGIGARRFFELFALGLVSGTSPKKRKLPGGVVASWRPETATVCAPLHPNSYLEREHVAHSELTEDGEAG